MTEKESKKTNRKSKDDRYRNWTFLVYPESAPENWRDILDDLKVPWVESPLHDSDINPDGGIKKSHWHVELLFTNKKSYEQVLDITNSVNGTIPQRVEDVRGMTRYFAHMDNPSKAQYSPSLIIGHNGVDVATYLKASSKARYESIKEMRKFISDNDIIEYCDLFDYACESRSDDWLPLLCDNSSYVIDAYIRSRRNKKRDNCITSYYDVVSGEVLKFDLSKESDREDYNKLIASGRMLQPVNDK